MKLTLKKSISDNLRAGHPWVYRDALEPFEAAPGEKVTVVDRKGRFIARGLADEGAIGVRVWTTRDEALDGTFVRRRILRALELRDHTMPDHTNAYRWVHGEGDRLAGFVLDRYGEYVVARIDGSTVREMQNLLAEVIEPILKERGILGAVLRHDKRANIEPKLWWGEKPPESLVVQEHGMKLRANVWHGQKTGLFLDHRESRYRTRRLGIKGRALNLYGYTGGFSVAAKLGGASHVTTVDIAKEALRFARETWADNGLDENDHNAIKADVPEFLKGLDRNELFDLIVCDPPSFAPNQKSLSNALHAYETLHERSLRHLNAGGFIVAASCSSHVTRADFEACLLAGSRTAGRVLQIVDRWGAPADHPRLLAFSESDYLKVTLARSLG